MSVIREISVKFGGSFQCRLATDPAASASSPKGPSDPRFTSTGGSGWTFAYDETPFDRIIRFANPVQLRNALMEPFTAVMVTSVDARIAPSELAIADAAAKWQPMTGDKLLGLGVSLGPGVYFDASKNGPTHEELMQFKLGIGGDAFTADAARTPTLDGATGPSETLKAEYLRRKPGLISAATSAGMSVARSNALTPEAVANFAIFYSLRCDSKPIVLTNVDYGLGPTRFGGNLLLGWRWVLSVGFFKFDGDTLVGRVEGELSALPPLGE